MFLNQSIVKIDTNTIGFLKCCACSSVLKPQTLEISKKYDGVERVLLLGIIALLEWCPFL